MTAAVQVGEIESILLGRLLLEPREYVQVRRVIEPANFSNRARQIMFEVIGQLLADGKDVDYLTVAAEMNLRGANVESRDVFAFIDKVNSQTTANAGTLALIMAEYVIRGSLKSLSGEMTVQAGSDMDVQDLIENTRAKLTEIAAPFSVRSSTPIQEGVLSSLEHIESMQKLGLDLLGVTTGFKELDKYTAGWQPGTLYVIAARPSMGKSALVQRCAVLMGVPVGLFSLEMSTHQIVMRQLAQEANVPHWVMRHGKTNEIEWKKLGIAARKISRTGIVLNDNGNLSLSDIETETMIMKQRYGIRGIIIDYLQLMRRPKADTQDRALGIITSGLKALAKREQIFVILLSQLSRAVETRPDKRPQLSDLRESGNIEGDADAVIFVYRPEYYRIALVEIDGIKIPSDNLACFDVGKNRDGPVGPCWVRWLGDRMLFCERTEEREQTLSLPYKDSEDGPTF